MITIESFDREDPYAVLELDDGINAPAKKIGKSFNRLKHRARAISDTAARVKRLEQLEQAKEQLQRPDDRVVIDFSYLGTELFRNLIQGFGKTLSSKTMDTDRIVQGLLPQTAFDELIPKSTTKMTGEIRLKGVAKSYRDISDETNVEWFK